MPMQLLELHVGLILATFQRYFDFSWLYTITMLLSVSSGGDSTFMMAL